MGDVHADGVEVHGLSRAHLERTHFSEESCLTPHVQETRGIQRVVGFHIGNLVEAFRKYINVLNM